MEIKIISILVVLLLIATTIPSMSTATAPSTSKESKLWLRGIVRISEIEDDTVHAYAIRLHYFQWGNNTIGIGPVLFHNVAFPDNYLIIRKQVGKIAFVIGISTGELEFEWE